MIFAYSIAVFFFAIAVVIGSKYKNIKKKFVQKEQKLQTEVYQANLVLQNMNVYFLLINKDFIIRRTNYYDLNRIAPVEDATVRVGDLLSCRSAVESGQCGTHERCKFCRVRAAIGQAFYQKKDFQKLEASMNLLNEERSEVIPCDVSVSGHYLENKGEEQMILTIYDITELKNVQRLLNIEKENAISVNNLKSAFIANMSHEVRTPLNAIVGFSGLLATASSEEEKKIYADIIAENNERLLQLITDILDLSQIESGTLDFNFSVFDVNDVLRELHGIFDIRLKDKPEVTLICEAQVEPFMIYSERQRIAQVLTGLIKNAVKFTPNGKITFGCRRTEENEAYFYVSDTGIGIPEEERSKIFDRFTKLDREIPGTGLGLALSQTIIQNLGGNIGVDSTVNVGSCFWFTLPIENAPSPDR